MPASSSAISSTSSLLDGLEPARERALKLLRRNLGLIKRLRLDQVADRFCLRQINAAIEKRAHGELARLGQSGTLGERNLHDVAQDDRRPVRRDFDNVIGGVGVWFLRKK